MQVQVDRKCCDPVMLGDGDVWFPAGGREYCDVVDVQWMWECPSFAVGVVAAA